jgi:Flp pilus assembly protein CpaB
MKNVWNKYTRAFVIILFASLLSLTAFYLNQQFIESKIETKRIVVAKEHVPPHTNISDLIEYREVVVSEIPQDAIYDINDIKGDEPWFTEEIGLTKGYPIKKSMISTASKTVFGPSSELEGKETRFIGVATDQVRSAGDYIHAGVRVDAYVFIPPALDLPEQVISPQDNPKLANLLVHDRQNSQGKDPSDTEGREAIPAVAILEVTPDVAKDLVKYQEIGKVYLLPTGYDKDFYNRKASK